MTDAPRAMIYARYSTDLQNPRSVEDQFRLCRRKAEESGWRVVGEHADHGISGTVSDRPGINALEAAIRAGLCDVVVIELLDRIARDQEHAARFFKIARHFDVELHEVSRGKVTPMTLAFSSTMSSIFLEDLADRVRRGHEGRVLQGKSPGGRSYGYKMVTDPEGETGTLVQAVCEEEAAIVRRIFRAYADGTSPRKIAADLNAYGIPSPRGRGDGSGHWKQNTINGNRERGTGILNNELYIGRRIWNRLTYSKHPDTNRRVSRLNPRDKWITQDDPRMRIVDDALWEAVKAQQDSLASRKGPKSDGDLKGLSASQGVRRRKYLLSGLLECRQCGGNLTVAGSGSGRRYYCANAKEKGPTVCAGMKGLKEEDAAGPLLGVLKTGLMQDEAYAEFARRYRAHMRNESKDTVEVLRLHDRKVRALEKTYASLMRAVEGGKFSDPVIDRLNAVDEELKALRARRGDLEPVEVELSEDIPALYRKRRFTPITSIEAVRSFAV